MRYHYSDETRKEKNSSPQRTLSYIFSTLWQNILPDLQRHSQAELCSREVVTIGLLFSLKGTKVTPFRENKRDYGDWFGDGTLLGRCG